MFADREKNRCIFMHLLKLISHPFIIKFIDMKSEIKELIKSFKSKKKNGRDRYNEFLYYCFMAYDDKVKPKLPDKVRNKYIIMRDSMLKYLIANEQEVIDQLSK